MRIGYMRVSSETQNLARQDLGDVDKVFEEKVSGASAKDRPALNDLMDFAREGDEVIVKVLDIDRQGKVKLSRKAAFGKKPTH